ncbi:MAG: ATP-binding protein, partial [Bacteroidales bacterium]|nr:ATP-binding protein [Bacteroidales bacterium]
MAAEAKKDKFNPFPGLRPFLREESGLFFGRENETREVIRKLLENQFIAVIGTSGSGKSSLVNSGVIPELLKNDTDNSWKIISLHPGSNPLKSLADAFARSILGNQSFRESDDSVISHLKENPDWISSSLKNLLLSPGEKVLLVVDQFEELFRNSTDDVRYNNPEDSSKFAGLLENAVRQKGSDLYVIIIVRSDFVGECAGFHGLIEMMNNSNFLVPRMTW